MQAYGPTRRPDAHPRRLPAMGPEDKTSVLGPAQSHPHHVPQRRSFLTWLIYGLNAVMAAVLGVPILCYIIDPRHRKGASNAFRLVEGIRLQELDENRPTQGVLRDVRRDAWTLHPNDVIGRVWIVVKNKTRL